ncbi:MAG: 50S ribosomal protein L15 [Candidatus Altiarchaeota archaeon]|nr:50S ribosomal protein L15 [Candidatus Altiarchaeota archaeon]
MVKKGRGTRTHGHGSHKRGGGRRGGRGYAGAKDSKWILTIKGGKTKLKIGSRRGKVGHLGKRGFTRGGLASFHKTINLRWIQEHFQEGESINLKEHGFEKLLGSGRLTKKLKIIAPLWSSRAEEKITAVGGTITNGKPKAEPVKVEAKDDKTKAESKAGKQKV